MSRFVIFCTNCFILFPDHCLGCYSHEMGILGSGWKLNRWRWSSFCHTGSSGPKNDQDKWVEIPISKLWEKWAKDFACLRKQNWNDGYRIKTLFWLLKKELMKNRNSPALLQLRDTFFFIQPLLCYNCEDCNHNQ